MTKLVLWCLLFFCCWPLAIVALLVYPLLWLLGIPFRLLGATVSAVVDLVLAVVLFPIRLPFRILRG